VFDSAEFVAGICAEGCATFTRKQIDELTEYVKRPQIGAKGLVWVKYEADGSLKSSVGKFYSEDDLKLWVERFGAKPGDLMLILCGKTMETRKQLCELRLELGGRLGLRDKNVFKPLWVIDFPMFEWDEETQRFYAMHHPFTRPMDEDIALLDTDTGAVRAYAYDMVVNGVELGGGSERIYNPEIQEKMFTALGFTKEEAYDRFGFLLDAFKYGVPPHAGLAYGLDRLVMLLVKADSIREVIAFPKVKDASCLMTDAPNVVEQSQLDELSIAIAMAEKEEEE
jgi:aspartyl-tRNA synthetase